MGKIILNGTGYGGSGGSGGHTIVDPNGTDMPKENKLQFTGAVSVSDDSVNGQTVVDIEGGGNYYLNTIYSTEEKTIGYWTDGKPLYQKTWDFGRAITVNSNAWADTSISNANIEAIVKVVGGNLFSGKITCFDGLSATADSGSVVKILQSRNVAISVRYLTLQYTKTADTPELNPQTGGVIYLPSIYSEEEREVGVWTDGRPLYQITLNPTVSTGDNTITHNIANLRECVSIFGECKYNNLSEYLPLPYVSKNIRFAISLGNVTSTTFLIGVGDGFSSIQDCYVTLQYTKTTDTAGSGTWTPSGANAVHYSTNEQVVGTWTDGSTLYERTVVLSAVTNGIKTLWSDTNISIKNHSGFFRFRSNGNVLTLWSRSSDATYKATVEELGTNTSGVYCDVGMGTARSGLLDLHITVQYTKN